MKCLPKVLLFCALALPALINAQEISNNNNSTKRFTRKSYVCPPNFIRLSHRCYFFSEERATWQDAYFQCRDLHSNLAIIKTANQDKLIRRTLNKKREEPLERWLGGRYDWEQMTWKWAASGKPLSYQGFSRMDTNDKEELKWHCIVVDPRLQYKWNTKSCVEEKHFICHTKLKIVTNKGKKKLLKQYNVNKYNKLNEIPVPYLPEDANYNVTRLKEHHPNGVNLNSAEFALKSRPRKRKTPRKNRKNRRNKKQKAAELNSNQILADGGYFGGDGKSGRNFGKEEAFGRYVWKTYTKNSTNDPNHPKTIVEEFDFLKAA